MNRDELLAESNRVKFTLEKTAGSKNWNAMIEKQHRNISHTADVL